MARCWLLGELHALFVQVCGELLGGAGRVGAHLHRHPPLLIGCAQLGGQLSQRGIEHDDVIGSGVRAGLPRAQQLGDRAVSTNNTPPACETSDSPPTVTDNQGCKSLCFTAKCLSARSDWVSTTHDQAVLSRHFRVSEGPCRLRDHLW
jgi:hypothetical protein